MFFSTSSTWQRHSSLFKAQFKHLCSLPYSPRFSLNLVGNSYYNININTFSSKFLDYLIYCTILPVYDSVSLTILWAP